MQYLLTNLQKKPCVYSQGFFCFEKINCTQYKIFTTFMALLKIIQ